METIALEQIRSRNIWMVLRNSSLSQ